MCSISIKKCRVFLNFSFLVTSTGENMGQHYSMSNDYLKVDCGSDWDVQVPSSSHVVGHDGDAPYTIEIASQRLSEMLPLKAKGKLLRSELYTVLTIKVYSLIDPNEVTLIKTRNI